LHIIALIRLFVNTIAQYILLMLHITSGNKHFPPQLLQIPQPPHELFIESNDWAELVDKPMLAVVGSRSLSPYGRAVTENLVRSVAARGVIIVSGLALGIDSVAHQAALDAGGTTIAVLPSGLDTIYPSTHRNLAKQIVAQGGALVTEYPPKVIAGFKGNFIARNRLIAGLSQAVLVTEAAAKSGSLHTANFAIDQGKDVLAVPGPITNLGSAGCNSLIKTGATPITSAEDIFEALKLRLDASPAHGFIAANAAEHAILQAIHNGLSEGEHIYKQSALALHEYQQTLSMLEITGKIKATGGDTWALK
jgi:DNA processing protein